MNKTLQTLKYIFFDYIMAILSWTLFFAYRKIYIESLKYGVDFTFSYNSTFIKGVVLIPILWLFLYYLTGYYKDIYRKSRLKELWNGKRIILVHVL
jgi:hypothetical protein